MVIFSVCGNNLWTFSIFKLDLRHRRREEEELEDEEHDSDLDDFIDDSEFDELSRRDLEETLKYVLLNIHTAVSNCCLRQIIHNSFI